MRDVIPYAKPHYTEREAELVQAALMGSHGARAYEFVDRFQTQWSEILRAKYVVATSSCTGALHLGLAALGLGPGDEVILGDVNWIATAAPITYLGARPVFVDVLAETWCLDPERVAAAMTPRTKAIIAVHLYGNVCAMDRLQAIAAAHGVPLIEDAAEAVGSRWGNRHVGGIGAFGTFSFHWTKTISTGEGGLFVTNDAALFSRVRTLNNHGRSQEQTRQLWPDAIGYKYKMSNIQAAVGCAQIERFDQLLADKRRVFAYYLQGLRDLPLSMNTEPKGTVNGFWMPTIVVDASVPFDRDGLFASFSADGIDTRVLFWPLSSLPMFTRVPSNAVAYGLHGRGFNLPSYFGLTELEMDRIMGHIRRHLGDS
jgi:perosamine synthetase